MVLAIAYNHKDCFQALKLLGWISFLSERQAGGVMQKVPLVIVASRHAAEKQVHQEVQELEGYFKEVRVHVPETENETGWPASANFMFKETLQFVEREFRDDLFWLEPDAIPLHPLWWETLMAEWDEARARGKVFMGNYVTITLPHMTGIGVYGKEWRQTAPKLLEVVDTAGWDVNAADQVLPNAHITHLIQHIFYQPVITDLSILEPNAVVFHQDKKGVLIGLLAKQYGPEIERIFSQPATTEPVMSMKFYYTPNSNRHILSQGHDFVFDPVDCFGGLWRGIYATDKESEIIALNALVSVPTNGVEEISEERYRQLKKKLSNSSDYQPLVPPAQEALPRNPAAVVDVPPPRPPEPPKPNVVANLEDILKIDTVKPHEPTPNRKPGGRKRNT